MGRTAPGQSSTRKPYTFREEHDMATVHDVVCGMDIDPAQAAGTRYVSRGVWALVIPIAHTRG